MPSDRLQTRLLPRASARLISLRLLWWFFLVNPLLFLWRGAAEASGSVFYGGGAGELVSEAPSGDWSFRVPMEIGVPPSPRQPAGARGSPREGRSIPSSSTCRGRTSPRSLSYRCEDLPSRGQHTEKRRAAAVDDCVAVHEHLELPVAAPNHFHVGL